MFQIEKLEIGDYHKCSNIWDMSRRKELAEQFYNEMLSGNRVTYIYKLNDEFVGEISIVFDAKDSDYTISEKRLYISRLIVKQEFRRRGIGKALVEFITKKAAELGYSQLSIGVDIDNFAALKLYVEAGFNQIIFIGEDEQGKYVKLMKSI